MRDRMERLVLLPFTVGCISESSIAIGPQYAKRSKMDTNSAPTRDREEDKEEEEEEYEESLSGENLKGPSTLLALPRFQKLFKNFKNFSQSFVYKDDFEEAEMGMDIGYPTDVKHVTHVGLDGCASSILSTGWDDLKEPDTINLPSFPLTPVELAMATHTDKPSVTNLLETK